MKTPERYLDYLIGEVDGAISIHAGRGYFKDSGNYKTTLSVPIDPACLSEVLCDQLSRFGSIYAIDTNKRELPEFALTASCAFHIHLEYQENNRWNAKLSRLPAIIRSATQGNPEVNAWVAIIEALSPRVRGMMALVVDSELGDLPLFNARAKPIFSDFYLPANVQLIYASAERDLASPLNKAIEMCDNDANAILDVVLKKCDLKQVYSNIQSNGFVCILPSYA